jgi:hypothetical protein
MTARSSFLRKIYYIFGMGALFLCLYMVGRPATKGGLNLKPDPGGLLAQMRDNPKYKHISQTQLGEIDPTSETVKLATLGLRGVATLLLWEKANDYKMREDWAKYEATLNQIAVVQPHLISVWIHLAWNLSYNTSVEFDDYHDRYHWVIEGIKYLQKGVLHNDNDPRLLWELGWTISQKIGRADEHKLYRKLFFYDDEFHNDSPRIAKYRDNWLVGEKWYERCIEKAEATGKRVKGKSPLIYNSSPAMCLMNYADAIEEEGTFKELAKDAWKNASIAWFNFGQKLIPDEVDSDLYLGKLDKYLGLEKEFSEKLDALDPGLKERIRQKKYDALDKEKRQAVDIPVEKRTTEQHQLASEAEAQLEVTYEEIAKQVPLAKRAEAKQYADEALKNKFIAVGISRARDIVNFAYWKLRAEVEQEQDALDAREKVFEATQKFRSGKLNEPRDLFHNAFLKWRDLLDKHPDLIEDSLTQDDLMDMINVYKEILNQLTEPFPKPFILQDIIDKHGKK